MAAPADAAARYTVVSADGHAGADLLDYRPYLESEYHDRFDAWAATYVNPYEDLLHGDAERNWDSARRLADLERDGIVAEVLFPNTIPPFYPSMSLSAQQPSAEEYELRWAGLRAHNRWMADFCAEAPGRRAGTCQVLLGNMDDAVAEVRWARDHGLFGESCCPGHRRAPRSRSSTRTSTSRCGRSAKSSTCRSTTTPARRRRRSARSRPGARSS